MLALTLLVQACRVAVAFEGAAVLGGLWKIALEGVVSPCAPDVALLGAGNELLQLNELRNEPTLCRCPPRLYFMSVAMGIIERVRRWFRFILRGTRFVDDFAPFGNVTTALWNGQSSH